MPEEEDAAVAKAFGMSDDAEDAQGAAPEQEEEAQEAKDVAFEELPDSWQEEIRRLRRENAAQRVARRDATKTTNSTPNGDSPSAQALRAAEGRGRDSARLEYGVRLAGAEVRAALSGSLSEEQIADIVEDLNLSRFVLDDGEVDRDAVRALRDKYASIIGKKPVAKVGHGQRNGAPTQKSNADLFGAWLNTG